MKKQLICSKYSLILLSLFSFLYSSHIYANHIRDADSIYNFFKRQMNGLPQSVKDDTLLIGVFNQATGDFTGKGSENGPEIPNGHGGFRRGSTILYSKGLLTHLKFNLSSNEYTVLVFDGVQFDNNGKNYIVISINRLGIRELDFKISAGAESFANKLKLLPYLINAVGAFTLSEVPLGIMYIPPGVNNEQNYAAYSTTESFRTTISISTSNSSSITKSGMDNFSNVITIGKQIASGIGGSYGTALGIGLDGLSTNNITETIGETVTDGYEVSLANIASYYRDTKTNRPGSGNVFLYITNVRFIFCIKNSEITISLLDFKEYFQFDTKWLKDHEPDRYNRLKLLDPFTNRATPNLESNSRYIKDTKYGIINLNPLQNFKVIQSEMTTSSTSHSQVKYSTKLIDHQAGWMTSTFGGDESYTKTVTLSQSRDTTYSQTSENISEVRLLCPENGARMYGVYFDNLFKSIIVIDLSSGLTDQPIFSGILYDKFRKPVPNSLVYVMVKGKKITAKTDKAGKFNYYVKELIGFKGTPSILKTGLINTKTPTFKLTKSNNKAK